jgi:hypothetical protein
MHELSPQNAKTQNHKKREHRNNAEPSAVEPEIEPIGARPHEDTRCGNPGYVIQVTPI